jgi:DNA-binding NarL/FixJ family response regulator
MISLNQTFLIIEDQVSLASLIDKHINTLEGVRDVIVAKTAEDALNLFSSGDIDFVLLDLMSPSIDGIGVVSELQNIKGTAEIIIISEEPEVTTIKKVAKFGISAFVSKIRHSSELAFAISSVRQGRRFFSDTVLDLLLSEEVATIQPTPSSSQKLLSNREIEILECIVDEMTSKQIANALFISKHTVETHKRRMMQKLKVTNTAGLIKATYEKRLLDSKNND